MKGGPAAIPLEAEYNRHLSIKAGEWFDRQYLIGTIRVGLQAVASRVYGLPPAMSGTAPGPDPFSLHEVVTDMLNPRPPVGEIDYDALDKMGALLR